MAQCSLSSKLLCSQLPATAWTAFVWSGGATARCQTRLKKIARSLLFIHCLIQPLT